MVTQAGPVVKYVVSMHTFARVKERREEFLRFVKHELVTNGPPRIQGHWNVRGGASIGHDPRRVP